MGSSLISSITNNAKQILMVAAMCFVACAAVRLLDSHDAEEFTGFLMESSVRIRLLRVETTHLKP
jgi:hypothetical protein